jgi:DNA-binding MarR family transcriptional regulator
MVETQQQSPVQVPTEQTRFCRCGTPNRGNGAHKWSSLRHDVFEYVREHAGQTATEIAFGLTESTASVSSLLKKLVSRGVIARDRRAGFRRGYEYRVTAS